MIRVYGASKLDEAETWRTFKVTGKMKGIELVSRWPFTFVADEAGSPEFFAKDWIVDQQDVARCDIVIVLPPREGVLRGALVEVGMGIALGKRIILVGDCPDYGTWQYHPMVTRVDTLEDAAALAVRF